LDLAVSVYPFVHLSFEGMEADRYMSLGVSEGRLIWGLRGMRIGAGRSLYLVRAEGMVARARVRRGWGRCWYVGNRAMHSFDDYFVNVVITGEDTMPPVQFVTTDIFEITCFGLYL